MKYYVRLSILLIFALLMLQTSYAQATEFSLESITQGTVNFAETGDIDGDGSDDLVYMYGARGTLATGVSFSNGNSFSSIIYDKTLWYGAIGGSLFVEDVNGDDFADILFIGQEKNGKFATVFISNGDGTFRDTVSQALSIDESLDYQIQGGDIDGDHRFDLIFSAMINDGTETVTRVLRGQPDGLFK